MKDRFVQVKNPRSKRYVKIDKKEAKILGSKKMPYVGIPLKGEFEQLDEKNNRIELDLPESLRFKCCKCGLIHLMSFAIEDDGNLGIAIERE